jgi:type IV secretory pathway ATPase VirB11/archaellum biosynthesis ATPase
MQLSTNTHFKRYKEQVRKIILANYVGIFMQHLTPDKFVSCLNEIFNSAECNDIIERLAEYVEQEVDEKKRPLDVTLKNIAFFVFPLSATAEKGQSGKKA